MLVKNTTPEVLSALNNSKFEPTSVRLLDYIEWPTHEKILCFDVEHSQATVTYQSEFMDINEDTINEYISQKGKFKTEKETIKAHMINLDWFYRDGKTIINLAEILKD